MLIGGTESINELTINLIIGDSYVDLRTSIMNFYWQTMK